MRSALSSLTALFTALAAGCGSSRGMDPLEPDAAPPGCEGGDTYPANPVEPMAVGEVLFPYSWPQATSRRTGETVPLNLGDVPCAQSDDIDWSPFDVLLFVSIPAW
jgi:hypothetical protein